MYDNEEEIKRKRRNLIIVIAIVIILIIILLIFLLTRGSKKKVNKLSEPKCELEVVKGTLGENGVYNGEVIVGFKSKTAISDKVPITNYYIGLQESKRNENAQNDEYTVTKSGEVVVHGYVKDEQGNKGTCELKLNVKVVQPTCELEVTKGTLGNDGWYTSDVVVSFKSKESNSEETKIEKYYLETKKTVIDSETEVKANPTDNIESITVKDNLSTTIVGHVIDDQNNEGTCELSIKKDSSKPTCSLTIKGGEQNSSGKYVGTVVVAISKTSDDTTTITSKGVGVKENYDQEEYSFDATQKGNVKVYGYVKDQAGNKGTCELVVEGTAAPKPSPSPQPTNSYPSCTLSVNGYTASWNDSNRTTNNGAKIVSFGMNATHNVEYNGLSSYTATQKGASTTIYGYVKDSYGNTATCNVVITIPSDPKPSPSPSPSPVPGPSPAPTRKYLSETAKVGSYVKYDAGKWSSKVAEPANADSADGKFVGQGADKNTGVACGGGGVTASGWQVYAISGGKVTLIHNGVPECYCFKLSGNASTALSNIKNRANEYVNKLYASSAAILSYDQAKSMPQSSRGLASYYYVSGTSKSATALWAVRPTGVGTAGELAGRSGYCQGIRPLVTLEPLIYITGGTGSVGSPYTIEIEFLMNSKDFDIEEVQFEVTTGISTIASKVNRMI